jgi:hypothetical protein
LNGQGVRPTEPLDEFTVGRPDEHIIESIRVDVTDLERVRTVIDLAKGAPFPRGGYESPRAKATSVFKTKTSAGIGTGLTRICTANTSSAEARTIRNSKAIDVA